MTIEQLEQSTVNSIELIHDGVWFAIAKASGMLYTVHRWSWEGKDQLFILGDWYHHNSLDNCFTCNAIRDHVWKGK